MAEPSEFHRKYRPASFDEVIGQDVVVESLQEVLAKDTAHAFLFLGPSGVGKTTLARIVAVSVGCAAENIREIDAATYTGIDAMREVMQGTIYHALGASSKKAIIVDEVHALSKAAFQALLKSLEEPPAHVYWLLCTTEPAKVPQTIRTRTLAYTLKGLSEEHLLALLDVVRQAEGLKLSDDILGLIAEESLGSARQALVYLQMCMACKTTKDAAEVLRTVDQAGTEVIDFCRWLVAGQQVSWERAMQLLEPLKETGAEGIRIVVVNYLSNALMGAKSKEKALPLLRLLNCFSEPCNPNDKLGPILLATGRAIFEE